MIRQALTAALARLLLSIGAARAQNVGFYLVGMLDNIQSGYRLDIGRGA